jgi:hypothetical protein
LSDALTTKVSESSLPGSIYILHGFLWSNLESDPSPLVQVF